jgi:iron complex transport system substrate-binding protein
MVAGYVCLLLALSGCEKTRVGTVQGAVQVRDDLGRVVVLHTPARRVVSLAPSLTEMLCAVGGEAALVGVTRFCDYPVSVRSRTSVGDIVHPSLEAIFALRPDLVVMSMEGNTRSTFDRLIDLHIPVFVSNPRTIDGIYRSMRDLGVLLGDSLRALRVTDSLRGLCAHLSAVSGAAPVSVLLLVSAEPFMAAGEQTTLDELIRCAGARNAAAGADGRYPVFTREEILRRNPDVLLWSSDLRLNQATLLRRYPEWKQLRPFAGGIATDVDANLFLRPGPRLLQGLSILRNITDSARSRLNTR